MLFRSAEALWTQYREVLTTYLEPRGVAVDYVVQHPQTGLIDPAAVSALLAAGDVAGVVLQSPNALGVI